MDTITQSPLTANSDVLIDRPLEMSNFAALLPLDNFNLHSTRIFNIWGENGVGKSTFIASFREYSASLSKKILWISPISSDSIDTPQEFIAACSKGVRFPKQPDKEESIAKKLDESQRGKVDPLRSDDAILITRSSAATNKKPYVNAAAAASVGRTSFVRDDMEVSVGFGSNRSGKQAEAFLEALPLQSMGTDMVALDLSKTDPLSRSVKDWFRDYVIPAATKGPFRRNLVVLAETAEQFEYGALDQSFGEWDGQSVDFHLHPANEETVCRYALERGCSPQEAQFAFIKGLGFPQATLEAIQQSKKGSRNRELLALAATLFSALPTLEKAKLAACCLPETLFPDELDVIFGNGNASQALAWLASLPSSPIIASSNPNSYSIPDDFRFVILNAIEDNEDFVDFKNRWLPYGRLTRVVPDKSDRTKLYLLAGLNWIEPDSCRVLFGESADNVSKFLDTKKQYFVKRLRYTRISDRLRDNLIDSVNNMGHMGISSLRKQTQELWNDRRDLLNENLEDLDRSLTALDERMQKSKNKNEQLNFQLKNLEKSNPPELNARALAAAEANNNGLFILMLVALALTSFIAGSSLDPPIDIVGKTGAGVSLFLSLFLIPGWNRKRLAKAVKARAKIKGSPESLRKESLELTHQMQTGENARDELQRKVAQTTEELKYSYV